MRYLKKIFKYLFFLLVLLCLIPYLIPLSAYQPDESFKPFVESKYLKIEGVKFHYRVIQPQDSLKGNILLIHGFSGSTFSWRKNIASLSQQGYRVLLVDLPAFGYSDRQPNLNHANSNRAKWLWQIIQNLALQKDKWTIAGHSMGAGVALAMGFQKPENIQKIILVDGAAFGGRRGGWLQTLLAFPPIVRWVAVVAEYRYYNPAYFQELLSTAYSQPANEEAAAGYLAPFKIQGSSEAILGMFRHSQEPIKMTYEKLQAKTYLVWGENDKWVSIEAGKNFVKQYPQAQLFTIAQAGHNPMETHPKEFNQLLNKVIND
jgi:2-hydroxy-6-oxonona-2,4-dienedioate hydrolase